MWGRGQEKGELSESKVSLGCAELTKGKREQERTSREWWEGGGQMVWLLKVGLEEKGRWSGAAFYHM